MKSKQTSDEPKRKCPPSGIKIPMPPCKPPKDSKIPDSLRAAQIANNMADNLREQIRKLREAFFIRKEWLALHSKLINEDVTLSTYIAEMMDAGCVVLFHFSELTDDSPKEDFVFTPEQVEEMSKNAIEMLENGGSK